MCFMIFDCFLVLLSILASFRTWKKMGEIIVIFWLCLEEMEFVCRIYLKIYNYLMIHHKIIKIEFINTFKWNLQILH